MDVQIDRGDIVLGADGAPRYITGDEELLQRVMIRLTARRGGFSPFPELGSTLYQLRSGGKEVVRAAVEEALRPIDGVRVLAVESSPGLEQDELLVTVRLQSGAIAALSV